MDQTPVLLKMKILLRWEFCGNLFDGKTRSSAPAMFPLRAKSFLIISSNSLE